MEQKEDKQQQKLLSLARQAMGCSEAYRCVHSYTKFFFLELLLYTHAVILQTVLRRKTMTLQYIKLYTVKQ